MDENNTNQAQNNGTQQETQQQQVVTQEVQTSASANKSADDSPKFSQREMNAIVQDRVNSLNSKIKDLQAQLQTQTSKAAEFEQKYNDLQNTQLVADAGVPADYRDYILFESKKIVALDAKKSMADAVKEVVEAKKSMLGIQTPNGQSTQTQGNPNQVQGRQPVQTGNSSVQGNANNSGNTVDAEVQAFLDKKFGKRR